jgi:hypothetical protein
MDLNEIRDRLDVERRGLARAGETLEQLPEVTRLAHCEGWHLVAWSRLEAESADAVIAREVAHHQALGVGFEWKLYAHDGPIDLLERLERHGFQIGPREAVLVYDLRQPLPGLAGEPERAVVRVRTPAEAELFEAVEREAFGERRGSGAQLREALASGSTDTLGYIAYLDEEPACVGRLYTHPESRFGGLYGGGTRPGCRRRGCYRALVAARARDAAALGARYLQVDALPTSRPILERLGFVHLTDTWPCEWPPR